MIYLDYAATTPVNPEVQATFNRVTTEFIGNPNSIHRLGGEAQQLIKAATNQIANLLQVKPDEIIYTSGASESNNLALKGICFQYQKRGKHIITSPFEHASVMETLKYLQTLGFEVDQVKVDANGIIKSDSLKQLLRSDTILVTINAVNSEIGIRQPITELAKIVKANSNSFFHSDFTQLIGKSNCSFDQIDLASFSAHKFNGLKGIGVLIKRSKVQLVPLIHGGKSTTVYRSGTPCLALIVSLAKALRLALVHLDYEPEIQKLNAYLQTELKKIPGVTINSNGYCLPQILNISVFQVKPESLVQALALADIFISTQTACATKQYSQAVLTLTNDFKRAQTSVRISLATTTTLAEIKMFLDQLKIQIKKLRFE